MGRRAGAGGVQAGAALVPGGGGETCCRAHRPVRLLTRQTPGRPFPQDTVSSAGRAGNVTLTFIIHALSKYRRDACCVPSVLFARK